MIKNITLVMLLKSERKGEVCGCKCYNNEKLLQYCKRHLNMLEKESK